MKVFIFDYAKCNGCRNCQISCKDEHVDNDWTPYAKQQPDTGQFWCKINERTAGKVPHVQVCFELHVCNHCKNPSCALVCEANAFEIRKDGLVVLKPDDCTGCMKCVDACPYQAIFFNEERTLAQKCTGCAHLLDDGWELPRCVDACCTDALRFGDEQDFAEEIATADAVLEHTECCPRVYYLNDPKRFIAGTVVDLTADEVLINADVTLSAPDGTVIARETSDFLGNFWFRRISASLYTITIEKEGYFSRTLDADVQEEEVSLGIIDLYLQV